MGGVGTLDQFWTVVQMGAYLSLGAFSSALLTIGWQVFRFLPPLDKIGALARIRDFRRSAVRIVVAEQCAAVLAIAGLAFFTSNGSSSWASSDWSGLYLFGVGFVGGRIASWLLDNGATATGAPADLNQGPPDLRSFVDLRAPIRTVSDVRRATLGHIRRACEDVSSQAFQEEVMDLRRQIVALSEGDVLSDRLFGLRADLSRAGALDILEGFDAQLAVATLLGRGGQMEKEEAAEQLVLTFQTSNLSRYLYIMVRL